MTLMSNELANEQQQLQSRQLAGVILKNTIKVMWTCQGPTRRSAARPG